MNFKIADRLASVEESSTLKMNALVKDLKAKGQKVINLTAGEPDFAVPKNIRDTAIEAVKADFSKYTPVSGIPELREAISKKFKTENRLEYSPDRILVSAGAKQSIFNFLLATVNPGDEVIIPSPYWVSYPEMVKVAGGTPVLLATTAEQKFRISPQQLKAAITPKTKALILNYPSNPTGMMYSLEELKAIAKVLEGTNVWVISDEIYEKLVFDGTFCSFASVSNDAFSRTVTVNGFSKAFAMTGWRLGYAAGPKPVLDAMTVLQGQSTSGANSIAQKAAIAAFQVGEKDLKANVETYRRRRDKFVEIFSQSPFFSFVKPEGAFYFFLNIEAALGKQYNHDVVIGGSEDVSFYLLQAVQVGTVAGRGFGADNSLRLSFAVSDQDVEEGAKKIVQAMSLLH